MQSLTSLIGRLGIRFALVLAVALLPLTIVSVLRSQSVIAESEARSQAALRGETLRALAPALGQIERTKGAAVALAQSAPRPDGATVDACRAAMRALVDATDFSFAGFIDLAGTATCSSAPDVVTFGVTPILQDAIANPRMIVEINQEAPVSGTSVIYVIAPVYGDDGALEGFAAVSAPHATFEGSYSGVRGAAFLTLNRDWTVVTSTAGIDAGRALLPQRFHSDGALPVGRAFTAHTPQGQKRIYAVVPLVAGSTYAIGTWPAENHAAVGDAQFYLSNPAIFPALMWLASLLVAWFACEVLVIRHVKHLRGAMVEFAQNRRPSAYGDLSQAPTELRDAGRAFREMATNVIRDEAELEDALRQKDLLLREVHHRVKNNLQLIASIMNMQMRRSRSPEVQVLMRGLHDRVMSLSTIHRGLYQTSGLADVRADELLADIVRQVLRIGSTSENSVDLETALDPRKLVPDQAVPLGLLVTEALTNALKYIGAPKGKRQRVVVRLQNISDDKVRLQIANSVTADSQVPDNPAQSTGLGTQLLEAFSQQLGGKLEKEVTDYWFTLTLEFTVEKVPDSNVTMG